MDSVTQAALGAVVGGAVAGRTLGRKAFVLGAIAGTLPDLDIVAGPFLDDTTRLTTHRSATHSLILMPMLAALLAWRMPHWAKRLPGLRASPLSARRWFALLLWCFVTHIALDWCTVFGTQLWFPLSTEAYALNALFIIDPFYTAPLLVALGWVLARNPPERARRNIAWGGLALSGAYLAFAVGAHALAFAEVKAALASRGIDANAQITYNTPFNAVLWQSVALVDDGYWTADYSLAAGCGVADIQHFPAHPLRREFVAAARDHPGIERLVRFSKGFFRLHDADDGLRFSDLRFGVHNSHPFQYRVGSAENGVFKPSADIRRVPLERDFERVAEQLSERLRGHLLACERPAPPSF